MNDLALLLARRACYRLVALALADPRTGTWEELAEAATQQVATEAADLLREEDAAVARPFARGERPLADLDPGRLFARLPKSAAELNDLYEANFGLLGGSKCPPYETEYVPHKFIFQRSHMLADVAGFYRAFGLQTSSTAPERPDHIALECEFLAQVCYLQGEAAQGSTAEAAAQAEICQHTVQRFLSEHFVWWAPALARLLGHQDPGGFYEAVAQFLAALVAAVRALAEIEPPRLVAEPSPIENADECSGCELATH
jgi:TorA maturation chaperone TorD